MRQTRHKSVAVARRYIRRHAAVPLTAEVATMGSAWGYPGARIWLELYRRLRPRTAASCHHPPPAHDPHRRPDRCPR